MGYVYYGNYAMYYEVARVESLRQLGMNYKDLEKTGTMMPVVENHSRYLAPARYDDLLTIVTTISEKPTKRITFQYELFNEEGKRIHEGSTVLVFVNMETGKTCLPPESFEKLLLPFFSPIEP